MIEERIARLEELVQKLHGSIGHVWYQEEYVISATGRRKGEPVFIVACACGATDRVDEPTYKSLPNGWAPWPEATT